MSDKSNHKFLKSVIFWSTVPVVVFCYWMLDSFKGNLKIESIANLGIALCLVFSVLIWYLHFSSSNQFNEIYGGKWFAGLSIIFLLSLLFSFVDELRASTAIRKANDYDEKRITKFVKASCLQKKICEEYKDNLQKCASAGDIDRCVEIKMNGEDTFLCKLEELPDFEKKLMPTKLNCLITNALY